MLERILDTLAAMATIAAFLLEAWKMWREHRKSDQFSDDVRKQKRR